jgi:hypothetical protein
MWTKGMFTPTLQLASYNCFVLGLKIILSASHRDRLSLLDYAPSGASDM